MHGIGEKRKRRKVYRRKSAFKNELRYLFLITIICFVLAFCLVFITGKLPSFLDKRIQQQADWIAGDKMKDIEKEMMEKAIAEDIDDIVKKYKDRAQPE